MQAFALAGPALQLASAGPRAPRVAAKPTPGYEVEYSMFAVTSVRTEAAAEDSLAAILARSRFGMAIAAMIKMIATTISNSINEKPFCLRILVLSLFLFFESSVSATRLPVLSQLSCHNLNYQSRHFPEDL